MSGVIVLCADLKGIKGASRQLFTIRTAVAVISLLAVGPFPSVRGATAEAEESFVTMFDGRTLKGWHAVPAESESDWSVREGVIVGSGSADRLSYLVWHNEALDDFELALRYRLPTKGNSGIEIRAQADPSRRRPFVGYHADFGHVGIGARILGAWDFHFDGRRTEHPCHCGTRLTIDEHDQPHATEILGALKETDVRDGDWNEVRVIAAGHHFQYFINGKLASEFTDNAQEGRLDRGAIGLQIHDKGMRVEFKDLRIKRPAITNGSGVRLP